MNILVLCVDRDNDLGSKAGIRTPLIGREENLNAGVMIALKDPEDSDANSIFAAISQYDELKQSGDSVEIATISGSTNVGYQSDRILASQLDQVIDTVSPDEVILVSDGAEDEAVYPVISSRVNIASVRRVIVKQQQNIEGTYYIIKSALREKRVLTPVALLLMIIGGSTLISIVAHAFGYSGGLFDQLQAFGVALTAVIIAIYIISFSYDIPKRLSRSFTEMNRSFRHGHVRFTCYVVALIILALGGLFGERSAESLPASMDVKVLSFLSVFIVALVVAILTASGGRALDLYLNTGRRQWSYWVLLISLSALALILYGSLETLKTFLLAGMTPNIQQFLLYIVAGLLVATLSSLLNRYIRSYRERASRWRH